MIRIKPLLVFDDKPKVIKELIDCGIHVIRVCDMKEQPCADNTVCIDDFDPANVLEALNRLLGKRNWECIQREVKSDRFFRRVKFTGAFIKLKYRPVVLNKSKFVEQRRAILFAPNHIRTVDPLVIESIIMTNVHWVALKRFFDGNDSIFSNSKNAVLCWITKTIFRKLEFFPVERKQDNENANNMHAIKDMSLFLRNGFNVGIFPEGTTRKTGDKFFGTIDPSFVELAIRNKAVIQPILIYWIKGKKRPVLNFGDAIIPDSMNKGEIFSKYMQIQEESLEEAKQFMVR